MKKYFLALVCFVFFVYPNASLGTGFSTTHALSLKGVVTDAVDNEADMMGVNITLSTNPAKSTTTKDEGNFKIKDFTPPVYESPVAIKFEKAGYITESGKIGVRDNKYLYYNDQLLGEFETNFTTDELEGEIIPKTTYSANNLEPIETIQLYPNPAKLISGTVYYETEDGDAIPLADASISLSKSNTAVVCGDALNTFGDSEGKNFAGFPNLTCDATGDDGKFEVWGYFKKDKNGKYIKKDYKLIITDNDGKYKPKDDTTYQIEDEPKENIQIILKEKTISQAREDNLTGITGFKCNELMPKYLAGANCNDNKTLEGDATDLAYWIQKIGGKIAGAIAMIAVVLIVWNAFNMVTAAGDEDKISTAKKGLMWAIIGLALTMFAYVIVKTVIMLAYTQ